MRDYVGKQLDETAAGHLERVRTAAARMGQLIEDLLELSRVSRTALSLEIVELSRLAEMAIEDFRSREPERRVEAVIETGDVRAGRLASVIRRTIESARQRVEVYRQYRERAY